MRVRTRRTISSPSCFRECSQLASRRIRAPLRRDLAELSRRISDLLPILRDHVCHPHFGGSFTINDVVPALVPGLVYEDCDIQDGGTASSTLEALPLGDGAVSAAAREKLRDGRARHCERDTLAMVRPHERLRDLAGHR